MAPPIALNSPQELIASIPYLLGHHPKRSLVAITTTRVAGSVNVGLVARTDLDSIINEGTEAYEEVAITAANRVDNPVATTLVVVDDHPAGPGQMPYADLIEQIRQDYETTMPVQDVLYTNGDTFRSYLCTDPGCPCITGAQVSEQTRTAVQAEFVAAGAAPAPTREAVVAEWSRTDDVPISVIKQATAITENVAPGRPGHVPMPTDAAQQQEVYERLGRFVHEVSTQQVPVAAVVDVVARANHDVRLRDALLAHSAHLSPTQNRAVADQIRSAAIAMPVHAREAAAVVAATNYYLAGDGPRAQIASDAALAANPDSAMGTMLNAAVHRAIPPSSYREMLQTADGPGVMSTTAAAPTPPPPVEPPAPEPAPSL